MPKSLLFGNGTTLARNTRFFFGNDRAASTESATSDGKVKAKVRLLLDLIVFILYSILNFYLILARVFSTRNVIQWFPDLAIASRHPRASRAVIFWGSLPRAR